MNPLITDLFLSCLKLARVIPIHESDSKTDVKTLGFYLTTLLFIGEVFERLINFRLYDFFVKYKVFYSDQYGLLKNKSTTDTLLKFIDLCYSIFNNKQLMISIFLDFSKAFDTADHDVLCQKLNYYGIRDFMVDWIKFHLTDRLQFVSIGDSYLTTASIKWGVLQGSILGPLLLSIYINGQHKCVELNTVHYADDSTVYVIDDSLDSMVPLVYLGL